MGSAEEVEVLARTEQPEQIIMNDRILGRNMMMMIRDDKVLARTKRPGPMKDTMKVPAGKKILTLKTFLMGFTM